MIAIAKSLERRSLADADLLYDIIVAVPYLLRLEPATRRRRRVGRRVIIAIGRGRWRGPGHRTACDGAHSKAAEEARGDGACILGPSRNADRRQRRGSYAQ